MLAQRFGWTQPKDAVKIEQELMCLLPGQEWLDLAHRMIYHGRATCTARKPLYSQCTLAKLCPSANTI